MTVAVLFARRDSIYKTMPGCDVWDADRDARKWPGGCPVVAHPPCRGWGRLRQFALHDDAEKDLARLAVDAVRNCGGVLEHPAESTLWADRGLPRPGAMPDKHGGWTLAIRQFDFGHRAEKKTWLYICGTGPDEIPAIPKREGSATHCIRPKRAYPRLPSVTKPEREKTPPALAEWLVCVARMCQRQLADAA